MANEEFAKRRQRVRLIWGIVIALLAGAIVWGLLPRPVAVDFAQADTGSVRVDLVDEGRTRMHDTYIVSAPVSGRVLRVEVEPGDTVTAGAVVARMTRAAAGFLDSRTDLSARAAVDASAAQLRSAETALELSTGPAKIGFRGGRRCKRSAFAGLPSRARRRSRGTGPRPQRIAAS
jgi:HlyD family secretion protein